MIRKFKKWSKTPRYENEYFTITEKIDGANGCVVIMPDKRFRDGFNVFGQSRNRIVTLKDDNQEFAAYIASNRNKLLNLGIGYHYGEWWGKGIQRNYGLKEKRFSLFRTNYLEIPDCCNIVPVLETRVPASCLDTFIRITIENLVNKGSSAAPGFMNIEGIIIQSETYPNVRYKYIINK